MSPSDLRVFGLVKRAAAADEAGGSNAAKGNTAAAGWLGKGCGARVVRELRLLHTCVLLCFIKSILVNRHLRSRGFIVSVTSSLYI